MIENDKVRLPLESYGTGVHQLIILATAFFSYDHVWFCIEEPEIHFHPRLQKELLRFLIDETDNAYILTTHSNAFLCLDDNVSVLHLSKDSDVTSGKLANTTIDILTILGDLGVCAADLLQANFVMWVEGPSDRIYLNKWLSLMDPTLKEGFDYSIMFYGGRLISHLTMEREEECFTESFVQLLRLNQHTAILIDSDRSVSNNNLNATKNRIVDECSNSDVLCWVTWGREIENYLSGESVSKAYNDITSVESLVEIKRFAKIENSIKKAYENVWKGSFAYEKNKPAFARKIASHISHFDISSNSDLSEKLNELIRRIKYAV